MLAVGRNGKLMVLAVAEQAAVTCIPMLVVKLNGHSCISFG